MYDNPRLVLDSSQKITDGTIHWRSPSNIAIIKYWGKHGEQLPRNPSLSFTLAAAYTETALSWQPKERDNGQINLRFYFHGNENEAFRQKVLQYLERLLPVYPFLRQLDMTIHTANSFPHSAGIASSASAMSALALCLCSLEDKFFGTLSDGATFDRKASWLARLGSGSACRSIFPHASVWGATPDVPASSDELGVGVSDVLHPVFKNFHDDILIVSAAEKSVSSRVGHALMENNPFAAPRYALARQRMPQLLAALRSGDVEKFGDICENEALALHALMMTSQPSYILMRPESLQIIERVRRFRQEQKLPVYFTLDAGPNIHLLYPEEVIAEVRGFVESQLRPLCEKGFVLHDWVGEGPEEL